MALSETQVLLLQQMCIDGELRCHKRAAEEAIKHNDQVAAYYLHLRERYVALRDEVGGQYEAHDMKLVLRQIYDLIDGEVAVPVADRKQAAR
jgi:hypothetical protein